MVNIDKIFLVLPIIILILVSLGFLYFLCKFLSSKKLILSFKKDILDNEKTIDFLASQNKLLFHEVNKAREISKAFYPKKELINNPRFDIFGISIASDKISGDYYDVFSSSDNLYFGIGDVTGHGLSSSILSLIVSRRIRTFVELGIKDIPSIIESCSNEIMYEGSKYMSLLLGKIYPDDTIDLWGKQESVLISRLNGLETLEDHSGFILGNSSFEKNSIPTNTLVLYSGEFMVLYTDGVTELENSEKETIGIEGILRYIDLNIKIFRSLNAAQICQEILDFLTMWGADNIEDDITLLVIKKK